MLKWSKNLVDKKIGSTFVSELEKAHFESRSR